MMQPSLTFASLTIPAAMKVLGSFRTLDHLPEELQDGLIDMIEYLMNCFPDAADEYHRLMDLNARNKDFNHVAEALRVLVPAVESVTYPLHANPGTMFEDTPLISAMTRHQRMMLLREFPYGDSDALNDEEWETLFGLTDDLLEEHPTLKADLDQRLAAGDPGLHYIAEAYNGLVEAGKADQPQIQMAA